jgi:hypothetical protein
LIDGCAELLSEETEAGRAEVVTYVAGKAKTRIDINSGAKLITFDTY